jgi:hypothetical protein
MKLNIKSDKPIVLLVDFYAPKPAIIGIKGYEKDKANTLHIDRKYGSEEKPFTGRTTLKFPFPNRFGRLKLEVVNMLTGSKDVVIEKISHVNLKPKDLTVSPLTRSFIKFAQEFAKAVGHSEPGLYASDDQKFQISLLDKIRDYQTGEVLDTPARINHQTGLIEVSKTDFDAMTVTNRFYILLHEYVHYANNTTDEVECDLLAAKTCMELGYSAIECLYSVSKLFMYNTTAHPTQRQEQETRVKQVRDFISKFAII